MAADLARLVRTPPLDNGSRIIGLPASEGKVRVYSSVALLLIDEASRVDDNLYRAMRPTIFGVEGASARTITLSNGSSRRGLDRSTERPTTRCPSS
jgi:hypothetical protein